MTGRTIHDANTGNASLPPPVLLATIQNSPAPRTTRTTTRNHFVVFFMIGLFRLLSRRSGPAGSLPDNPEAAASGKPAAGAVSENARRADIQPIHPPKPGRPPADNPRCAQDCCPAKSCDPA